MLQQSTFISLSLLLLLQLLLQSPVAVANDNPKLNETAADLWFQVYDRERGQIQSEGANARWDYAVNMTDENNLVAQNASLKFAEFVQEKAKEIREKFDWKNFRNPDLKRRFKAASVMGSNAANDSMQMILSTLSTRQGKIYNTAEIKDPISGEMVKLDPNVTRLIGDPTLSEEHKRQLWVDWHRESGGKMRQTYIDFVKTLNTMIREDGYKNVTELWQSYYEPKSNQNFEKMMENLWLEVKPLYQHLHAYVRRKLMQKYPKEIFPPTGQLPAHILGNMWAQSWLNIEQFAVPFPKQSPLDVSAEMRRQNWTVNRMVRESESFFTSIGLKPMTETFWNKSVFERIPNVDMVCHASAWDFFTGQGDFRIKQCTTIDVQYLATTHHEMGHIQYYQQYEHQPVVFRTGGNPGFHEAIGDILELSVLTPNHLREIGLLKETVDNDEYYINYLFQMALSKISFLPFGYLIDLWRWRVFDETVKPQEFNENWWKLRCSVQGVASPVKRGPNDFDPGAKYHVPSNTPYIRYFVSHILQFQLHEALCKAAGITDEIYKCSIYKSKAAGEVMKKLMEPGNSKHWEEILFDAIGTREISAKPLLKYFKKLQDFLEKDNNQHGVTVAWKDECPGDDWYDKSANSFSVSTFTVGVAVLLSWVLSQVSR